MLYFHVVITYLVNNQPLTKKLHEAIWPGAPLSHDEVRERPTQKEMACRSRPEWVGGRLHHTRGRNGAGGARARRALARRGALSRDGVSRQQEWSG